MSAKPWRVLARQTIFQNPWIGLQRVDLEMPDGTILRDIHMMHFEYHAVGIVPVGRDGRILLIEHYRFQTGTTGWEIPAGRVDPGECAEAAAARELREETGALVRELTPLGQYHPSNGSSDQVFEIFVGQGAEQAGPVEDTNEVGDVRWFTIDEVETLLTRNQIRDGLSLTALLWYLFSVRGTEAG